MPVIKKEVNVDKQVHDLLSSPFSPRSGGETRSVLQVSFSQDNFGTHTNVSLLPSTTVYFPPKAVLTGPHTALSQITAYFFCTFPIIMLIS